MLPFDIIYIIIGYSSNLAVLTTIPYFHNIVELYINQPKFVKYLETVKDASRNKYETYDFNLKGLEKIDNLKDFNLPYFIEEFSFSRSNIDKFDNFIAPKNLSIYGTKISHFDDLRAINLKWLDCSGSLITSLNSLDASNLNTLYCSNTKISNFANICLQILSCNSCPIGNNILKLNTNKLMRLDCIECDIKTFENFKAPFLESLECSKNPITTFKNTNMPKLKKLYCDHTAIHSFNGLEKLELQKLKCNNIILLQTLKYLNVSYLTELDIHGTGISSLINLNFECLKILDCSYTIITSFIGFIAPNLEKLRCVGLNIISLDGIKSKLKDLNCSECFIIDFNPNSYDTNSNSGLGIFF